MVETPLQRVLRLSGEMDPKYIALFNPNHDDKGEFSLGGGAAPKQDTVKRMAALKTYNKARASGMSPSAATREVVRVHGHLVANWLTTGKPGLRSPVWAGGI